MDLQILQRHFSRIGAKLDIDILPQYRSVSWHWRGRQRPESPEYLLDVREEKRQEAYKLSVREDLVDELRFRALDIRPADRHLLLLLKRRSDPRAAKDKFLCGHDERHWFISVVPESQSVSSVAQAMDALKPDDVRLVQQQLGVRRKNRHKRRNRGFVRQGEWFFVPAFSFTVKSNAGILHQEPISRGRGSKPHIVAEVYRTGGDTVYVCSAHPNGLLEADYQRELQTNPKAGRWRWRVMRRDAIVYARGTVRHPDHATITLPFWHRVFMNNESQLLGSGAMRNVVFLD